MTDKISWTWRHAIAKSDLPAATKHVLLTISLYMNEMGKGCYPTQKDLAEDTSLSERAVRKHIDIAVHAGWVTRREHGFRGQKWRNHEYEPRWPERQDVDSENQHVEKGAAPRSSGSAKGAEPNDKKVRHHVPPKVPVPSKSSLRSESARDPFDDFEGVYPKPMGSDRAKARKAFLALSEAEQSSAFAGAEALKAERDSDRKSRGESLERSRRFTPNASRWLEDRSWEGIISAPVDAEPLVSIKQGTPEFEAIERIRGRPIPVGMSRKVTVKQSELDAALAAERQTA